MKEARQCKPLVTIAGLIGVAAIPAAVFAAWVFGSALDRQAARWTTTSVTTSSTEPMAVPAAVRNSDLS
jgi:FlaG/FlaF family flagellin (archaellin)